MPIKTIEKTVDGHNVKIVQFNGVRGFRLKVRLFKLLLPILGTLFKSDLLKGLQEGKDTKEGLLEEFMGSDLSKVLPSILQKAAETIEEETFFRLVMDLLSGTFIDNRELNEDFFGEIFAANYFLVYKILTEVIKANNFFGNGDIGKMLSQENIAETLIKN